MTTRSWTYTWNGDDLERIERPDGTDLVFTYDSSLAGYLTRVDLEGDDDSSIRVLRAWEYDGEGNVTATWTGDEMKTGLDAVDLWKFAFDDPAKPTVTTVTDPLDNDSIYQLARDTVSSNVKVTSISGDCPTCGLGPNSVISYEAEHPLLPTRIVNGRGFATTMTYTPFGQLEDRTEADGTSEMRTTSWEYDPSYPALVTRLRQPSVEDAMFFRETVWTRDGNGNATDREIFGFEGGSAWPERKTVTLATSVIHPNAWMKSEN
jgi:YD repeat-containing protein